MAKNPGPSKKRTKFEKAIEAAAGVGVPAEEFGKVNKDGSFKIDIEQLEDLKKKLGAAEWSKVRFVALNAPFKRRSAISSA